jgi:hypothetical protein
MIISSTRSCILFTRLQKIVKVENLFSKSRIFCQNLFSKSRFFAIPDERGNWVRNIKGSRSCCNSIKLTFLSFFIICRFNFEINLYCSSPETIKTEPQLSGQIILSWDFIAAAALLRGRRSNVEIKVSQNAETSKNDWKRRKMTENVEKWPKMLKNDWKRRKMKANIEIWLKTSENDSRFSKNDSKFSNNDSKFSKNDAKFSKNDICQGVQRAVL